MEFLIFAFVAYFLPTIIALCRGHGSKWGILAMNILLGWSVIFWFWAFIWALSNKGGSQNFTVINQMSNHNGNT